MPRCTAGEGNTMDSKKKISIIIPIYNGEQYLARCIESVLQQEHFNTDALEIFLINDGSKDSSATIINTYQQQYPDIIRGMHQQNIGVARTRNKGVQMARGEYVMFLDQDDWLDKDYCQVFYEAAVKSCADVVYGGYRRPDERGNIHRVEKPDAREYGKYIIVAAWAKIHRTKFLIENEIQFFDSKYGEDCVFTVQEIARTKKWRCIDYIGYNWFDNSVSASNTTQRGLSKDNKPIELLAMLIKSAGPKKESYDFQYYVLRTAVHHLLFSGRHVGLGRFMGEYGSIFSWMHEYVKGALRFRNIVGQQGEKATVRIIVGFFLLLHKMRLVTIFAYFYAAP